VSFFRGGCKEPTGDVNSGSSLTPKAIWRSACDIVANGTCPYVISRHSPDLNSLP
jgi:hypothetical protein